MPDQNRVIKPGKNGANADINREITEVWLLHIIDWPLDVLEGC